MALLPCPGPVLTHTKCENILSQIIISGYLGFEPNTVCTIHKSHSSKDKWIQSTVGDKGVAHEIANSSQRFSEETSETEP